MMKPPRKWYPHPPKFLHWLSWIFCRSICFLMGIKRENFETFPKKGPVLVIAPHFTYIDWLVLFGTLPRPPHFIADSFFVTQNFLTAWATWMGGVLPIRRANPDPYCVRQYIRLLSKGELCVVFPEGARSMEGRALSPMIQAVKLISKLRIPVAVASFKGLYNAWPRWDGKPRIKRGAITVRFVGLYKDAAEPKPYYWKGVFDFKAKINKETEKQKVFNALEQAAKGEAERLVLEPMERFKFLPNVICFCPSCSLPDALSWSEEKDAFECRECHTLISRHGNLVRLQIGESQRDMMLADCFKEMIEKLLKKENKDLHAASKALFNESEQTQEPASLRIDASGLAIRTDALQLRIPLEHAVKASIKGTDVLELTYQGKSYCLTAPSSNAGTWILLIRKLAGWKDLFSEV